MITWGELCNGSLLLGRTWGDFLVERLSRSFKTGDRFATKAAFKFYVVEVTSDGLIYVDGWRERGGQLENLAGRHAEIDDFDKSLRFVKFDTKAISEVGSVNGYRFVVCEDDSSVRCHTYPTFLQAVVDGLVRVYDVEYQESFLLFENYYSPIAEKKVRISLFPNNYNDVEEFDVAYGSYKFVDEEYLADMKLFWELVLKPEAETDMVSISLSMREKLQSKAERKLFPERHYAMFERKTLYGGGFGDFLREVYVFELPKRALISRVDWKTVPRQEVMRVYVNINRSNGLSVGAELVRELCDAGFKINNSTEDEAARQTKKLLRSVIKGGGRVAQQMQNIKRWADYDIDLTDDMSVCDAYDIVHAVCLRYLVVGSFLILTSPNGLHLMVRKGSFKVNPENLLTDIKTVLGEGNLAGRNKNEMVCLPGTFAYDSLGNRHTIKVLNGHDFKRSGEQI